MKRNLTSENFEDFLKQSADSLRMKAPDRVWQNLSRELGKKRRRFFTGLSAFLLMATAAGYYVVSGSGSAVQKVSAAGVKQPTLVDPTLPDKEAGAAPIAPSPGAKVVVMQPRVQPSKSFRAADRREKATATVIPFNNNRQPAETENNLTAGEAAVLPEQNGFTPTVVDAYPEQETAARTESGRTLQKAAESAPLSIESIVNGYKAGPATKHMETQLYFTPTISYRKLTENKSYLRTLDPASVPVGYPALNSRVSNNVTHKPDVGFELGVAAKYGFSNRLKIRSGLQFNVNRYDVKAFSSFGSVATIALNNGSRIDSFNTFSRYSNINGYKSDWLQNLYFQLSLPVGVEYLFAGDEKLHFSLAATVQPTYVLGDRAYLITTDYKSYTEVPWLTRRWNVNTSLETFVTYKRWQFGPQVRYQLMSSFASKYPVKENLFDFGLKVGVRLNK